LTAWTLFVIGFVWIFYVRPPHDDEYEKWLFVSLLGTAMPWIFCSIPVLLIVFSLETRKRPRRVWITTIWTAIVACVAWVQLQPIFQSPAIDIGSRSWRVDVFAYPWLFGLLIALWIALWLEKKLVDRGLLT
jgi:hypothetical protein